MTLKHPSLYQINTRVLLRSLGKGSTLGDIPSKFWKELRQKGMDWVWLMGIWEIREKELDPHLISEGMTHDFRELVPDLKDEDICGSPYAVHDYTVDPKLGTAKELREIRKTLHKLGMKLMLDFVPNHLGAHTKWLDSNSEYFIEVDRASVSQNQNTFYKPTHGTDRWFAHGKDPYFDAWQDTIQLNYANREVHKWMTKTMVGIADVCDGVRCDMAMLDVRRIFQQTWGSAVQWPDDLDEFWPRAITEVKKGYTDFVFMAECYWDMEAELLEMGFDYCYDKVFYDRLTDPETDRMRQHFHAEPWWLERTARFLENHDEKRAAGQLQLQKHMAAAALIAFGPGMRFWHMGQWEGRRKRIPVQIDRTPDEGMCGCLLSKPEEGIVCNCIATFYDRLFALSNQDIFRYGRWRSITEPAYPGVLHWIWSHQGKEVVILINYSDREVRFEPKDILLAPFCQLII
jgi:glycosidase